jgi:predicted glycosyltransferase
VHHYPDCACLKYAEKEMRIVVDINHPAHVHYFKHFINEMKNRGHEILITASEKEVSYRLLDLYGFEYVKLGSYGKSLAEKMVNIALLDIRMYLAVKKFKPDIFIGFGSIRAAHVAKVLNKPCIALDDTEHAKWEHLLYVPYTDVIITPTCFKKDFGIKQIRYEGFTELAYLHQNRYTPDPVVITDLGLTIGDPFIIVRFVSWDASHDIGHHGILNRHDFIKNLEQFGRVFISSEETLPQEFQEYSLSISPEKIHDVLHFARLYIGEGATMATEAALLGTPSLLVSSLTGTMGNFLELEKTYDLLYSFSDSGTALKKALDILSDPDSKKNWAKKRERLLEDKIDVTAFIVWFIENYPRSFHQMKGNRKVD